MYRLAAALVVAFALGCLASSVFRDNPPAAVPLSDVPLLEPNSVSVSLSDAPRVLKPEDMPFGTSAGGPPWPEMPFAKD